MLPPSLQALLVDFDGTLVETDQANAEAYVAAFAGLGHAIDRDAVLAMAGRHISQMAPILAPSFDPASLNELRRLKASLYPQQFHLVEQNHRLIDWLRAASAAGIRLALVTSAAAANAEALLSHLGLSDLFEVRVTGDDVSRHKPDPEPYRQALLRLGIPAAQALALEDSPAGQQSAEAAGLPVLRLGPWAGQKPPGGRPLAVVMPMGGLGSRFAATHPGIAKPLIPVEGRPMFELALSSLAAIAGTGIAGFSLTLVTRADLPGLEDLRRHLHRGWPSAELVVIPALTRGAAETVLAARDHVPPEAGLVALDCDLWLDSPGLIQALAEMLAPKSALDGALAWFTADHPRYSYLRCAEGSDQVVEVVEKRVISSHAIAGAYAFAAAGAFFTAAEAMIAEGLGPDLKEFYISGVVQRLLAGGARFRAVPVEQLRSFGTPEELAADAARSR